MRTQVAIVGAGPAGLLLAHKLRQADIDVVALDMNSQTHVEARIRAGILERVTTDLLSDLGIDKRLKAEGLPHEGLTITIDGQLIPIEVRRLTGRGVTAYGQTEITKDLIAAAPERGVSIVWQAKDIAIHDIDSTNPWLTYTKDGENHRVDCLYVAGCDGFHGISRPTLARHCETQSYEQVYPFGWLGVLADVPPCYHEVVYSNHERGFALASMRSPTRSRYYIQVPIGEPLAPWTDELFWTELETRLGPDIARNVIRGPSIEKSIAPLRSFVFEPMRHGRLLLAGDAAHIVPPTGAKGLNLAASDVIYLSDALIQALRSGNDAGVDSYSARALSRIWKTEQFSWYLTKLLHRFPDATPFERKMQAAELQLLAESETMRRRIAESYVGRPL